MSEMIRVNYEYLPQDPSEDGPTGWEEDCALPALPTIADCLWRQGVAHTVVDVVTDKNPPEVWLRRDAARTADVERRLPDGYKLLVTFDKSGHWHALLRNRSGGIFRQPASGTDGDDAVERLLATITPGPA